MTEKSRALPRRLPPRKLRTEAEAQPTEASPLPSSAPVNAPAPVATPPAPPSNTHTLEARVTRWFYAQNAPVLRKTRFAGAKNYTWDTEARTLSLLFRLCERDEAFLWAIKDHYGFKTLREAGAYALTLARKAWPAAKAMEGAGGAVGQIRKQARLQAKLLKKFKPKE